LSTQEIVIDVVPMADTEKDVGSEVIGGSGVNVYVCPDAGLALIEVVSVVELTVGADPALLSDK
jgi:hypothetical protein